MSRSGQTNRRQEQLLAQLADASKQSRKLEEHFRQFPAPEVELLIKLHRNILLTLSQRADPQLLKLVKDLMKPVMDWARLEDKRKERQAAEERRCQEAREREAARQREEQAAQADKALTRETLEKIERELRLL